MVRPLANVSLSALLALISADSKNDAWTSSQFAVESAFPQAVSSSGAAPSTAVADIQADVMTHQVGLGIPHASASQEGLLWSDGESEDSKRHHLNADVPTFNGGSDDPDGAHTKMISRVSASQEGLLWSDGESEDSKRHHLNVDVPTFNGGSDDPDGVHTKMFSRVSASQEGLLWSDGEPEDSKRSQLSLDVPTFRGASDDPDDVHTKTTSRQRKFKRLHRSAGLIPAGGAQNMSGDDLQWSADGLASLSTRQVAHLAKYHKIQESGSFNSTASSAVRTSDEIPDTAELDAPRRAGLVEAESARKASAGDVGMALADGESKMKSVPWDLSTWGRTLLDSTRRNRIHLCTVDGGFLDLFTGHDFIILGSGGQRKGGLPLRSDAATCFDHVKDTATNRVDAVPRDAWRARSIGFRIQGVECDDWPYAGAAVRCWQWRVSLACAREVAEETASYFTKHRYYGLMGAWGTTLAESRLQQHNCDEDPWNRNAEQVMQEQMGSAAVCWSFTYIFKLLYCWKKQHASSTCAAAIT